MFYLTDDRNKKVDGLRPLAVDTVDSAESVSNSSTLTYNGKAAAGAISMSALGYRNVLNPLGTKHGSFWGDSENLVYEKNLGDGLVSIVETAASAVCVITDTANDLELMFESLTGTVKRYVLKVTDTTGASLYGWVYLVAKSGNTYTLDVVNDRVTQTQSWVGTLASFDNTSMKKVEIFKYESSLSFGTATTFTEEVSPPSRDGMTWKEAMVEALTLSNGQFFVDYRNGLLIGKRADTTVSETVTYQIEVASVGGASGATGTLASLSSEKTDDAAFTPATSKVVMMGATLDNATPDSVDEGDAGALRMSADRSLHITDTPQATSTYAPTNDDSVAYESSSVLKASAGTLLEITGYNSKASAQFIHVYNSATLPADTAIPIVMFTAAATSNFSWSGGKHGKHFPTGMVIGNSSTGPTKTIGSADCWFNAQFA